MSETKKLIELCAEYNVPVEDAINKIQKKYGYVAVHPDMPVFGDKLENYKIVVKALSDERKKDHLNKRSDDTSKKVPFLKMNYIIFTQSALRKKGFTIIIREYLNRNSNNSGSKIVIASECYEAVIRAVKEDASLNENKKMLDDLYINSNMIMLEGTLADEENILYKFIENEFLKGKSIIVFGKCGGLSYNISFLNKKLSQNSRNTFIYEREISSDGKILNPKCADPVFCEVGDQKVKKDIIMENVAIPSTDDIVTTSDGEVIKLLSVLNKNGAEGIIYNTDVPRKCAKIINSKAMNSVKIEKITIMCHKYKELVSRDAVLMDKIAWPEKLLYNRKKQVVGFLMKLFSDDKNNKIVPFSSFNVESFPKYIPNLDKHHQIRMAKSFVELIVFLHENNVILCDLNRENLLFETLSQTAYLVDLDSAQITDENYIYLSNVGRDEYFSPEHIGRGMYSFIHQKADDIWILQTFLFMMLTPLTKPYMSTLNISEKDLTRKGLYPFQTSDNHARNLAGEKGGKWHIIIGHFPKFLKEKFWNSFNYEGDYFKQKERLSAKEWFNIIMRYEKALPLMVLHDPNSKLYFPTTPKKYDGNQRL